ncbi:SusC/RagA family TonB-linked outer membrane protein [Cloacibacterium sp.]|uniref:SusC/RagA family TonB-linked outer membrane protein n=1 Tax=Cloacibacterium sp. TaxID=1913682 RepID=UPI0039E3B5B3
MKKNQMELGFLKVSLVATMVLYGSAQGQERTIKGTVTTNQKPIAGVVVSQEGNNSVTTTNSSGQYQFKITGNNAILIFKHPDYSETRVEVGEQNILNIHLQKEKQIDEVILNAGYYQVKDKERTGNIAKLSNKQLENQPVINVLSAAQGRISGVSIVQNSGAPGGGFDIQIRGKNSLRSDGSYPLIIVDGIPLNAQNNSISTLSSGMLSKGESSPLNSINPNDIESFEVLKDADATAIYGSRGANGVVLITTKRGKSQRLSAELLLNTSVSKSNQFITFADTPQYLQMRQDAYRLDNITNYPATAYDVNGKWDSQRNTNWFKTLIGKPYLNMQQQLSLSSGSEQTQWYMSIHRQEQATPYGKDYGYERKGFNLNMVHHSADQKFSISPTIYYTLQDNNLIERDLSTQIILSPNAPALYTSTGAVNWENNTFDNPISKLENQYNSELKTLSAQVNTYYQLFPSISLKLNAGYTQTLQEEERTNPSTAYNPSLNYTSTNSIIYLGNVQRNSWIAEPQITWNKEWQKHHVNTLIGLTLEEKKDHLLRLQGSDFASNDLLQNISNAKVQKVNEDTRVQYRYSAFYGRFNYDYSGKYLINLTARRDGSSRFGANNRFANFGAIGAAWIFSKENIIQNNETLKKLLSFGKLRASIGTAGSDLIGDYQYLDTYTTATLLYDGVVGMYPSRLYNPNFSWEKTTKLEAAIELGLLKERININFSWYRNRSSNQLVGVPLAATTGFLTLQSNFPAKVQNTGIEAEMSASIYKNTSFKWELSANFSLPKSKLLEYYNLSSSSYANTYVVGQPMNIKKVYEYKGVDPVTGVYQFSDMNGDGKLDTNDRQKVAEIGVKHFGGISNQFRYRNLSFSFLVQWVKQRQYSMDYNLSLLGIQRNIPTYMLDYWTPEHTDARYQRPTTGGNSAALTAFSRYTSSDAVIVDASFIRLNNVQLSYKIPLKTKGIESLTLIGQGQNLATITSYKGIDPEGVGVYLPSMKTYSITAILKF